MVRRCDQEKCAYLHEMKESCPVCEECGAEPHVVDEDCVNCWNCLKDIGYIRKGLPRNKIAMPQPQGIKITIMR